MGLETKRDVNESTGFVRLSFYTAYTKVEIQRFSAILAFFRGPMHEGTQTSKASDIRTLAVGRAATTEQRNADA